MSAPLCEVQKGKLASSIRAHPATSLEECEKFCDVDCMAYQFYLDQNKPRCAIWTSKGLLINFLILDYDTLWYFQLKVDLSFLKFRKARLTIFKNFKNFNTLITFWCNICPLYVPHIFKDR